MVRVLRVCAIVLLILVGLALLAGILTPAPPPQIRHTFIGV